MTARNPEHDERSLTATGNGGALTPVWSLATAVRLADADLAAALARGEADALTVLFKRHSKAVFSTARRIIGDTGEAEEIVQQVFLEVYLVIAKFDPQKGSFLSWLLRRAKHRSINRREHLVAARFYAWAEIDEEELTETSTTIGGSLHELEISPLLEELLKRLSARQLKVIRLIFFEGLTADEAAQRMKDSVHTVRHLLYDGLKKLRFALQSQHR
jgi:RNA polymerase sigma-70 factor, ECF subfamily